MIDINLTDNKLIAQYTPDDGNLSWIYDEVSENGKYFLKNTFVITNDVILNEEYYNEETISFLLGVLENKYIKLNKNVLEINNDIYIDENIDINIKFFIAHRNISIMAHLSDVVKKDIYIDSNNSYVDDECHIPINEFKKLIQAFPNSYEINRYADNRIALLISEYFDGMEKYKIDYEKYLEKKEKLLLNIEKPTIMNALKLDLLTSSYKELNEMLLNYKSYSEPNWQYKIKDILCVLFPKYVYAVREVDYGNNDGNCKHPDFTLIDSNGYIDVMEIKKPDDNQILRDTKNRNNYVPQKIFTDVIVQTAKYISTLNQNTEKAKANIIKKLNKTNPNNNLNENNIFINNPKGIILLGRSDKLNAQQKNDFELMRRQYKDITEIMTYDDLLFRLNNLIKVLQAEIETNLS